MKTIYYICRAADGAHSGDYTAALSGTLKAKYIIDTLCACGFRVEVLSCAAAKRQQRGKVCAVNNLLHYRYFLSLGSGNRVCRRLNELLITLQLICYIFRLDKGSQLVSYHEYRLSRWIARLRRMKSFRWTPQIEELYAYAWDRPKLQKPEYRALECADQYIVVNHHIRQHFEEQGKRCIVSHGVYTMPGGSPLPDFYPGKINVVYAGGIDLHKLGAITAARCAEFLPQNYIMHILGSGNEKSMKVLNEIINKNNLHSGCAQIVYHGTLLGERLSDFLRSCDIGLSSNIMEPGFANNTFPSKAITYIAHGLPVVTGYADIFPVCDVADYLTYFYEFKPECIAEAIQNVTKRRFDPEAVIARLQHKFQSGLAELLAERE